MSNYTAEQYIQAVNGAFKVNEEVLYAAIDNGTFSEFTLCKKEECYKYSNRELLVCQMFKRVPGVMNREVQTVTKGYAVNQIAIKANEYITSKSKVVGQSAIRIAELEAQVAELTNKLQAEVAENVSLRTGIKLQAKGIISNVVKSILR